MCKAYIISRKLFGCGFGVRKRTELEKFYLIAVALFIIGLTLLLIPAIFLGSINGRINYLTLKGDGLTAEEQNSLLYELPYSRVWWETQQATTFTPAAVIYFAIGAVSLSYGILVKYQD